MEKLYSKVAANIRHRTFWIRNVTHRVMNSTTPTVARHCSPQHVLTCGSDDQIINRSDWAGMARPISPAGPTVLAPTQFCPPILTGSPQCRTCATMRMMAASALGDRAVDASGLADAAFVRRADCPGYRPLDDYQPIEQTNLAIENRKVSDRA